MCTHIHNMQPCEHTPFAHMSTHWYNHTHIIWSHINMNTYNLTYIHAHIQAVIWTYKIHNQTHMYAHIYIAIWIYTTITYMRPHQQHATIWTYTFPYILIHWYNHTHIYAIIWTLIHIYIHIHAVIWMDTSQHALPHRHNYMHLHIAIWMCTHTHIHALVNMHTQNGPKSHGHSFTFKPIMEEL